MRRAGILAVLLVGACSDLSSTGPARQQSDHFARVYFRVELTGDPAGFANDSYVAIIDGGGAIPLATSSSNPTAIDAGTHTIAIVRTGLATDLIKPPNCKPLFATTRTFTFAGGEEAIVPFPFACPPPIDATIRLTLASDGKNVPDSVNIVLNGLFGSPLVYRVKTNQTTDIRVDPGIYLLGMDSPECPLPNGVFPEYPYGFFIQEGDVLSFAVTLHCK